jgi:hypothetical protein
MIANLPICCSIYFQAIFLQENNISLPGSAKTEGDKFPDKISATDTVKEIITESVSEVDFPPTLNFKRLRTVLR